MGGCHVVVWTVQLLDLHKELTVGFVEGHDSSVVSHHLIQIFRGLVFNGVDDALEELKLSRSLESRIFKRIILDRILSTLQILVHQEAEARFEKVVSGRGFDKGLLEVFLADFIVCLDHFCDLAKVFDQNG